jgi:signal-transduction protein with cAMP-binding, CBS, and nucleotidyltransferase domain
MKEFNVSVMAVFSRLVRDMMHGPPPTVLPAMPCGEALHIMRDFSASSIVVTSPERHPIGILTEQDVVRRVAFLNPSTTPVSEVMSSPVKTIHDDDYLFHGIAIMNRLGLRHLPVVDRGGYLTRQTGRSGGGGRASQGPDSGYRNPDPFDTHQQRY